MFHQVLHPFRNFLMISNHSMISVELCIGLFWILEASYFGLNFKCLRKTSWLDLYFGSRVQKPG